MKYCVNCGAQVDERMMFCIHCGARLNTKPAQTGDQVAQSPFVEPAGDQAAQSPFVTHSGMGNWQTQPPPTPYAPPPQAPPRPAAEPTPSCYTLALISLVLTLAVFIGQFYLVLVSFPMAIAALAKSNSQRDINPGKVSSARTMATISLILSAIIIVIFIVAAVAIIGLISSYS